jgi:hypothetical protein
MSKQPHRLHPFVLICVLMTIIYGMFAKPPISGTNNPTQRPPGASVELLKTGAGITPYQVTKTEAVQTPVMISTRTISPLIVMSKDYCSELEIVQTLGYVARSDHDTWFDRAWQDVFFEAVDRIIKLSLGTPFENQTKELLGDFQIGIALMDEASIKKAYSV